MINLRTLPLLVTLSALLLLGACGPAAKTKMDPALNLEFHKFRTEVNHWPEPDNDHDLEFLEIYDPWEPMNRNIYEFNAGFDEYFMLPVTNVYDTVIPGPARKGVNNVIENANEIPRFVNHMLQGQVKRSAITTSRFLINTTFGVFGLFDWASESPNLQKKKADFGQTFGVWGFGAGPYFVMPVFGPSNVRDTAGFGADFFFLLYQMRETYKLLGVKQTYLVGYTELILRALNKRSNTPFRYHSTGSPFEYELVRFVYTMQRDLHIEQGKK